MRVYYMCCDFGGHLGSLWLPFGPSFFGDLASSFRVGAKVASGLPKRLFVGGFVYNFKMILDALLLDLGNKLTAAFLAMPSESSEVGRVGFGPCRGLGGWGGVGRGALHMLCKGSLLPLLVSTCACNFLETETRFPFPC